MLKRFGDSFKCELEVARQAIEANKEAYVQAQKFRRMGYLLILPLLIGAIIWDSLLLMPALFVSMTAFLTLEGYCAQKAAVCLAWPDLSLVPRWRVGKAAKRQGKVQTTLGILLFIPSTVWLVRAIGKRF